MFSLLKEIKIVRILLLLVAVFLIADTIPHPRLPSGLIQGSLERSQDLG